MSLTAASRPSVQPSRDLVEAAQRMAEQLLHTVDGGEQRWLHTRTVAARAAQAAAVFDAGDGAVLQAAAWLHDIGYAPALIQHGFHPVDGAVHVREALGSERVAGLVAHHSGARFIAAARDLSALLRPFTRRESWSGALADALTWADQTTDPDGRSIPVQTRLREVLHRHGPHSPHARAHPDRAPAIVDAVRATEARLALLLRPDLPAGRTGSVVRPLPAPFSAARQRETQKQDDQTLAG